MRVGTADHGLSFHSGSNCPSKGGRAPLPNGTGVSFMWVTAFLPVSVGAVVAHPVSLSLQPVLAALPATLGAARIFCISSCQRPLGLSRRCQG